MLPSLDHFGGPEVSSFWGFLTPKSDDFGVNLDGRFGQSSLARPRGRA